MAHTKCQHRHWHTHTHTQFSLLRACMSRRCFPHVCHLAQSPSVGIVLTVSSIYPLGETWRPRGIPSCKHCSLSLRNRSDVARTDRCIHGSQVYQMQTWPTGPLGTSLIVVYPMDRQGSRNSKRMVDEAVIFIDTMIVCILHICLKYFLHCT